MRVEIRADNSAIITGYVNVTGRESRLLRDVEGEFIEIVKPKTFQRALERAESVGLMFNHVRALGSTEDVLELKEDNIGLYARAIVNDAQIIKEARAGKLSGWSFGFYLLGDEWDTKKDGTKVRTLTDIDLVEVSILDVTPAYIATSVEVRDGSNKLKELRYAEEQVELKDDGITPLKEDVDMLDTVKRQHKLFILKFE